MNVDTFAYTGQIWLKALNLYYYKARIYSPRIGRFLQTDPIGYKDQMNLYAYVGNDPVNKIDPTGMYASGAYFTNSAMYDLYGVEGTRDMLSSHDAGGEAALHILTAGAGSIKAVSWTASAYRTHRYNKRMEKIRERLKDWTESPNKKPGGSRFQDPNNRGNRVRVDKGKPEHDLPSQKVDHVVEQRGGKTLDAGGNEIKPTPENPRPTQTPEAHVPLDEWLKRR